MRKRPVIGITPGYMRDINKLSLGQGYSNGVIKAGGLAVILPLYAEDSIIESIMDTADGILFSGGADIDARYFGEENMKCGGKISPERDSFELLLVKKAIDRKMPVLGICRGLQLINTALGGTLHQDIHTGPALGDTLKHWQEAPDWYPVHDIRIKAGSRLQSIYGTETLGVNSFHHQAVKEAGNGLSIVAGSSDGITEAIEGTGSNFIVAVQWHPEDMWQENPVHLRIFEAFIEEAYIFSV
jgi:putative glutamine amidotransferase